MRKILLSLLLLATVASVSAAPAKRGLWQTVRLADGKEVRVCMKGDEVMHYYEDAEGNTYTTDGTTFRAVSKASLIKNTAARRARFASSVRKNMARARRNANAEKGVGGTGNQFLGEKKGLIILAQFQNKKFATGHDNALYQRIANEDNFAEGDFNGSVKDYFRSQSDGKFILNFDVVGPVTLPKYYSYYGNNDYYGNDERPGQMVADALNLIEDQVDFTQYDWDGDGEAEQVFVLYAGRGEHDGGASATIWPHMWTLSSSDYGHKYTTKDNITIDTYACSSELQSGNTIDGIGTFCHEFSHCLGFPDLYDTSYSNNFGMYSWDLMDYGSYNNDGFTPCNYTAYEKWVAGWIEPKELSASTTVEGLKAMSDGGKAYIIYNDAHKDEFYMLENRQQTGWDSALGGSGLLVQHVDYDESVWNDNTVNNNPSRQRCTIFHADNSANNDTYGDPYPYNRNDSLTNKSKPAATLYNRNVDGTKLMGKALTDITRNDDGTVSFSFRGNEPAPPVNPDENVVFNETFDKCSGTGGNDGKWSGNVASSGFKSDVEGWDGLKLYGGDKCARFGNGSTYGRAISPEITVKEGDILTFKAAPWGKDGNALAVKFADEEITTLNMTEGQWNDFSLTMPFDGTASIVFEPEKRFFLDEVKVTRPVANGIRGISTTTSARTDNRVYSITGTYVGTDISGLKPGLYITNGKKIVKK